MSLVANHGSCAAPAGKFTKIWFSDGKIIGAAGTGVGRNKLPQVVHQMEAMPSVTP